MQCRQSAYSKFDRKQREAIDSGPAGESLSYSYTTTAYLENAFLADLFERSTTMKGCSIL